MSVEEYSVAFGLPNSDAQNPFYLKDRALRVIAVVSYGSFKVSLPWPGPDSVPYSVGLLGLYAHDGTVLTAETPICK